MWNQYAEQHTHGPVSLIGNQTGDDDWSGREVLQRGGRESASPVLLLLRSSSFLTSSFITSFPPCPVPTHNRTSDGQSHLNRAASTPLVVSPKDTPPTPHHPSLRRLSCSLTAGTRSCSPQFSGPLRGSQTPTTPQPIGLTLHKLAMSPWCLVSQLKHAWPRVCCLPICCSFSLHSVTFFFSFFFFHCSLKLYFFASHLPSLSSVFQNNCSNLHWSNLHFLVSLL